MKRAALLAFCAVVAFGAIDMLADLTQDRPDRVRRGSRSEVVFRVEARNYPGPARPSTAEGLWGACQYTFVRRLADPGLVNLGEGRFRAVLLPELGEHAWRRLKGCLEDMTVDRVRAQVVSKRDFAPAQPPPPPEGAGT